MSEERVPSLGCMGLCLPWGGWSQRIPMAIGLALPLRTALKTTPKLPLEISPAISKSSCEQVTAQQQHACRLGRSREARDSASC